MVTLLTLLVPVQYLILITYLLYWLESVTKAVGMASPSRYWRSLFIPKFALKCRTSTTLKKRP